MWTILRSFDHFFSRRFFPLDVALVFYFISSMIIEHWTIPSLSSVSKRVIWPSIRQFMPHIPIASASSRSPVYRCIASLSSSPARLRPLAAPVIRCRGLQTPSAPAYKLTVSGSDLSSRRLTPLSRHYSASSAFPAESLNTHHQDEIMTLRRANPQRRFTPESVQLPSSLPLNGP